MNVRQVMSLCVHSPLFMNIIILKHFKWTPANSKLSVVDDKNFIVNITVVNYDIGPPTTI